MKAISPIGCKLLLSCLLGVTYPCFAEDISAEQSNDNKENTIVVTAELIETNILKLPLSVSVIDEEIIAQKNAQHFSELLNLSPNVNFATGASRGRFIQVRGIGERSEFSEPVNYSVGVMVDGIDLTGVASAATMLDTQQVEILRGPQGTLYGANALAGLINIVSNSPTETFYAKLSSTLEEYNGRGLSAIVSNSATENWGYRFAIGKYQSDGFMQNIYLNQGDTNNIDETSFRGKLVYEDDDNFKLTTSLLMADIDNGYDAFSLDSNRNTYSDEPGHDRQKSKALSLQIEQPINQSQRLKATVSFANSELEYGYDEDWSYVGICNNTPCDSDLFGFDWWYSSFDNYQRENENTSLDIQWHSESTNGSKTSWVLGLYARQQMVDLTRQYTYLSEDFTSKFDTDNVAIYGQLYYHLTDQWRLTTGLRLERRDARYLDSNTIQFNPTENLWGGKVSLEYDLAKNQMIYGLISRGYKAGGFNANGTLAVEQRQYETETMLNYETGFKGTWLDNQLTLQASLFYQDRNNIQTKQSDVRSSASGLSIQQGGECPCSFIDYLDNAAAGSSYGLELETHWLANDNIDFYATLGLLKAQFKDFSSYTHINADLVSIPPIPFNLDGRDVAHAPRYQSTIGINYFFVDNWQFNAEVESKDDFFFSDRHELKSDGYNILNLRITYLQDNWRIHLFANNLTDEDIQTRGFGSFGNDPRNFYETEAYYQFAAPRVIGVSASVEFD